MHLKINKSVNVLSLLCFEEVEENNKAKALLTSYHACAVRVGRTTGPEMGN